jgi:AcrR family transcriptional regulator
MAQTLNNDRPLGPRELQRRETRRNLAEHAIRLFKEHGFDETTVEEIASAAGVSTRTFFLHFPTKAAAAFPDHGERVADFIERLMDGAPHVNPLFHLRLVLLSRLEATDPSRLARYTLLSKVPELRDEDARTDRDYEAAICDYLMLHWGDGPEAELRANAVANTVIGVARAALSVGGEHGLDVRGAADDIMQRMFGTPFDEPLHSL